MAGHNPRESLHEPFLVSAHGSDTLTRAQARHPALTLTSRGVRLPSGAEERLRVLAAQFPLRPETVLSHATAAQLLGLPLPRLVDITIPAHVTAPRTTPRPRRRDLITHHALLPPSHVMQLGLFRITTPARTFVDMASMLAFPDQVALGDVVLARYSECPEDLMTLATWRGRYPGRSRAIKAIDWLDPKAESPRESHLRVLLRECGLPRPEVNGRITDEWGGFLAVGDLVFRRERVVAEYDGAVHATMEQRAKDAARRALLREHGWIVVEVVGEDMHYPHRVHARIRTALAEGAARLD